MPERPHQPTERYVQLMNERYDQIRQHVAEGGQMELLYDGTVWLAQIPVAPQGPEDRWRVGEGLTLELAVADLERHLGIPWWSG